MLKTIRHGVFAVGLALAIAGPATAQTQTQPQKIGVSYQPSLYWALPFYVADQKNWWQDVGLKPNYSTFPSGAPQVAAAASASWDVGGTGSAPAVLGAARFDIITVGITNDESAANAVLVRAKDLAAIKKNPSSLKGAQLLVTTNSTGEYAAAACMKHYGLKYPTDLNVVNLNQAEIISAFATGSGKLAAVWAPNTYTLEDRTGAVVLCSGKEAGATIPGALIARREFAQKHPEEVAKFLAVYLRAVNWIHAHPDEAVKMMRDFYAQTGIELPDKYLHAEIETRPQFGLDQQLKLMKAAQGPSTLDKWFADLSAYLVSTGTLQKAPDPSNFIEPKYMQMVADNPKLAAFARGK